MHKLSFFITNTYEHNKQHIALTLKCTYLILSIIVIITDNIALSSHLDYLSIIIEIISNEINVEEEHADNTNKTDNDTQMPKNLFCYTEIYLKKIIQAYYIRDIYMRDQIYNLKNSRRRKSIWNFIFI